MEGARSPGQGGGFTSASWTAGHWREGAQCSSRHMSPSQDQNTTALPAWSSTPMRSAMHRPLWARSPRRSEAQTAHCMDRSLSSACPLRGHNSHLHLEAKCTPETGAVKGDILSFHSSSYRRQRFLGDPSPSTEPPNLPGCLSTRACMPSRPSVLTSYPVATTLTPQAEPLHRTTSTTTEGADA